MTRLQLRTLCLDWLDDSSGSYFTSSVLNLRLNLAQIELQKRLQSANMEYNLKCVKTNTVAAQQAYALPSDFLSVVRLSWYETGTSLTTQGNKIERMTPNQQDLLYEVSGDPAFYTFQNTNILFWPIPDRAVEVHLDYIYQVAEMDDDADVPDMPDEYHEYIAVLATRDCLIKDGRPLAPIESKLAYYETLMKQNAVQRAADGPRMVTITRNDWDGI